MNRISRPLGRVMATNTPRLIRPPPATAPRFMSRTLSSTPIQRLSSSKATAQNHKTELRRGLGSPSIVQRQPSLHRPIAPSFAVPQTALRTLTSSSSSGTSSSGTSSSGTSSSGTSSSGNEKENTLELALAEWDQINSEYLDLWWDTRQISRNLDRLSFAMIRISTTNPSQSNGMDSELDQMESKLKLKQSRLDRINSQLDRVRSELRKASSPMASSASSSGSSSVIADRDSSPKKSSSPDSSDSYRFNPHTTTRHNKSERRELSDERHELQESRAKLEESSRRLTKEMAELVELGRAITFGFLTGGVVFLLLPHWLAWSSVLAGYVLLFFG